MYEIFEKLLNSHNMTIYKFCKETGVSESTIYTWKKKHTQCSAKLQKIVCEYFNVSVDYLMTGEEKEGGEVYYLNEETREIAQEIFENPDLRSLFDMSRKMSPERLRAHIDFIKKMQEPEDKTDI